MSLAGAGLGRALGRYDSGPITCRRASRYSGAGKSENAVTAASLCPDHGACGKIGANGAPVRSGRNLVDLIGQSMVTRPAGSAAPPTGGGGIKFSRSVGVRVGYEVKTLVAGRSAIAMPAPGYAAGMAS